MHGPVRVVGGLPGERWRSQLPGLPRVPDSHVRGHTSDTVFKDTACRGGGQIGSRGPLRRRTAPDDGHGPLRTVTTGPTPDCGCGPALTAWPPRRGRLGEAADARAEPRRGVAGAAHPLGPGVVRAVPALPAAPCRPPGRRHGPRGRRARVPLHPRRPDGGGRGLPRGAPRPARDRARPRLERTARDRPVAGADGRVPVLGRDHDPQPGDRLGERERPRRADVRRLPAGHVRALRADAPDPAPGRSRAGLRVARGPRAGGPPRVPVALSGRQRDPHRVPPLRLRERGRPLPRQRGRRRCRLRAHPPRRPHGPAAELVRRRRLPRHVRHRPCRSPADPDAAGGPGARAPWGPAGPGGHPAGLPRRGPDPRGRAPGRRGRAAQPCPRQHPPRRALGALAPQGRDGQGGADARPGMRSRSPPSGWSRGRLPTSTWPGATSSTPRATTRSRGAASTRQRYRWPPASPRASTRRRPCATGR